MAFQPGHRKVGGRRAGVPNKATAELRQLAAQLINDPAYHKRLRERLLNGDAGRIEPLLWQYACGKPAGESEDAVEKFAAAWHRILNRQPRGQNGSVAGSHGMPGEPSDADDADTRTP